MLTVSGGLPAWQAPAAVVPGWALAGNASTVPGTNFIGTTDTQRLVFKTNNIEQATILSNGNMGIGNTNPLVILDVKALVGLGNNLTTGGGSLLFGSANGALGNPGAYISGEKTGILGNRMDFYARDATGALMKNIMSISGENGNVGIGTITPNSNAKLDVVGNALVSGNITSPGTGSGSEKFGIGASVGADNFSLALGYNAITTGHESVAVGSSAKATSLSTALGSGAQATGFASTMIGKGAADNGVSYLTGIGASIVNPGYFSGGSYLNSGMINIGYNNISTGFNYTYLLGANLTTDRNNQMLIGNGLAGGFLNDIVLGGGISNNLAATYGALSIRTTDGSGANSAGMPLNFKAGKSTGSASGGYLAFYTTPSGVSGSAVNAEVERMRIDANGAVSFNGSAGTAGQVLTSAGAGAAPTWANASGGSSTSWSLTGNSGTTASNFLGTTDAQPLYFRHNNIASGIINSSNKTTSFGYSTLPSNIGQYNSAFGDRAMNANTIGYNNTAIGGLALYHNISGYDNTSLGVASLFTNTSGLGNSAFGRDALRANTTGNYNMGIGQQALTSNTTGISNVAVGRQTLYSNTTGNYNVGFGNAAGYGYPGSNSNTFYISDSTYHMNYKLDSAAGTAPSVIGKDANGYWHTYQAQGAAFSGWGITGNAGTDSATNFIGTTDNQRLVFKTNNVERASIFSNGSVGIGTVNTSDTTYKLFVEKGIRTRKVKVDVTAWPDYVFKPAYLLPSLNDLEIFLKENQHLPDIPSAVEVEKNGIDLGANQTILLKKVEELTLYMIELNKKVEALAKENEELKKKINPTNQ